MMGFKKKFFLVCIVLVGQHSHVLFGQDENVSALAAVPTNEVEKKAIDSEASLFSLSTDKSGKRLRLRVLGSLTQLKTDTFSVLAGGAGVEADYAFFPKWALNVGVSQALTFEDSLSALFTSLSMHWRYALLGRLFNEETSHSFAKHKFLSSTWRTKNILSVSLGLEQHFFNASSAIVPASGIGATLLYERFLWFIEASIGVKYAYLAFQGDTVSMITGVLGFNWMF